MSSPAPPSPALSQALEQAASETSVATSLIDSVEAPVDTASVLLSSGRRVEVEAGTNADRIVVRSKGGQIVLRIAVGDDGPVLSFTSATIDLEATKQLRLAAEDIHIHTTHDLRETIGGTHHTRVAGDERLEAARVEVQANDGPVAVRARDQIALDGEHIGLNDEPLPAPFGWSKAYEEEQLEATMP